MQEQNRNLTAINAFIFCGSASIGVMENGLFNLEGVFEISDDIVNQNAKHFIHNYPEIPVITPSTWENDEYLEKIKEKDIDYMFCNCPCSGLSQINRNASVDSDTNIHFYRLFNIFKKVKPKCFTIENAPTLLKLGKPILNEMIKELTDYNFTFIRDYGKNHGVAMNRQRTFVIGWRKDYFPETPIIEMHKYHKNVKDIIGDLYDLEVGDKTIPNFNFVEDRTDKELEKFFKDVPHLKTIREHICLNYEQYEDKLSDRMKKTLAGQLEKMRNNKRYWDKSHWRVREDKMFPSMASVIEIMHPVQDRPLTKREYARIMGYPDTFEFIECETPIIQCISQGVPVNYAKWISGECGQALLRKRNTVKSEIVYQHHVSELAQIYTKEEFINNDDITKIDKNKSFKLTF